MNILALYNSKGGVGKTAAAVNFAYLAAREGRRTLVWDLDPQAAATFYFRIKPRVKGTRKVLGGKRDLDEAVKGTDFDHLDLVPGDFDYRNMDLLFGDTKKPAQQLRKRLKPMTAEYDLVILDCPPSMSVVSENIFRAADALVVPTIPTTLSLRTLEQLLDFLGDNEVAAPVWPFFSMVDRRKRMHQQTMAARPDPRARLLEHTIPYASPVEKMGEARAPVFEFAPSSTAARSFRDLWQEVNARLET
ncbi:MAG: ParA family protein [Thiohalospira sp.]